MSNFGIGILGCKEDSRKAAGGWAPGNYMCKCYCCGEQFMGDKRSPLCADCAYGETENGEPVPFELTMQDVGHETKVYAAIESLVSRF